MSKLKNASLVLLTIFIALILSLVSVSAHEGEFHVGAYGLPGSILVAIGVGIIPVLLGYLAYFPIKSFLKWELKDQVITDAIAIGIFIFLIYEFVTSTLFFGIQSTDNFLRYSIIFVFFVVLVSFAFLANWTKEGLPEYRDTLLFIMWATSLAFHSFAEGIILSVNLTNTTFGLPQSVSVGSFIFHKFAEGLIGGFLFLKHAKVGWIKVVLLALLASFPVIPGVIVGFYNLDVRSYNPIFFVVSVAGILFILPYFFPSSEYMKTSSAKFYLAFGVSFALFYVVNLAHQINLG